MLSQPATPGGLVETFLRLLSADFDVETADADVYRLNAYRGTNLAHAPQLRLAESTFAAFVEHLETSGSAEPAPDHEDALSLAKIHVEEYVTSVDAHGENSTIELGLERSRRGEIGWYIRHAVDILRDDQDPGSGELAWMAEPPRV